MKISQPKTARVINTARVLSLIRQSDSLSKAEIARLLDLNKVSTGEIVDSLIEQGVVRETGKVEVITGRKPTLLELVPNAKYVLAVDIGRRNTTTALCNLEGKPTKIERVPTIADKTVEEFCAGLLKSAVRTVKLVPAEQLLGVGITIEGTVAADNQTVVSSFLPWSGIELGQAFEQALNLQTIVTNSLEAYVSAEKTVNPGIRAEEKLLYLDWGSSLSLAIVNFGKTVNSSASFGHMKVAPTGLCSCGEIGCLESQCSLLNLTQDTEGSLSDLWKTMNDETFHYLANALLIAAKVTGISNVIIGGEAASITDSALTLLQEQCQKLSLRRSALGERAEIQAAAERALDHFFYLTSALDGMKDYI